MSYTDKLYEGCYYHIYNRGINGENLFLNSDNCDYFVKLYKKHVSSLVDTYAYCLMKNHFHLLVYIKEVSFEKSISQIFSNMFNAYTKAFNNVNARHGSLFERPFKRKLIETQSHLIQTVFYIHNNPLKHGFTDRMTDWQYSSYNAYLSSQKTLLKKEDCLSWFADINEFVQYHRDMTEDRLEKELEFNGMDVW